MNRVPALRGKTQVRFSNPLAGHIYDNTKYQYSCFFEKEEENQWQQLSPNLKSKSVANYTLKKDTRNVERSSFTADVNSMSSIKKPKANIFTSRWLNPVKKCSKHFRHTSEINNPEKGDNLQQVNHQKRSLDRKKAMIFQPIVVKVLQNFRNDKDLFEGQKQQKQFVVHLGRYFGMFFKNRLQGAIFQQLCMFVQRHIEQVINLEQNSTGKQSYEQNYNITTKKVLYQKLLQLDKNGNRQLLQQLLREFCIPSRQTRQIFLNDLMSMIVNMLYERFDLNKNQKYVLITDKGKPIRDFLQIKFSTKKLFVVAENQLEKLLQQYFNQASSLKLVNQKCSFRQTLKSHFRNQLTKGNYDEHQSSNKSFNQQMKEKRLNLSRAQRIINFKNQKHCQGRKRIKRLMQISRNKNNKSPSPEIKNEIRQPSKCEKKVLSTDERLIAEFKKLKRLNDYENAEFKNNQNNRNKIQFGIIARQSPYFKNKTESQIERIFMSIPFKTSDTSIPLQKQTLTEEQYLELRKIIGCLAERQSIVGFVDRYLRFDEYGELQKQGLKQTLLFVIGEGKTSQVILLTIWSWLQKNGVIINESLSRGNMQQMYERNKIVYYFLISLIFGTNETTALDLAEDIL